MPALTLRPRKLLLAVIVAFLLVASLLVMRSSPPPTSADDEIRVAQPANDLGMPSPRQAVGRTRVPVPDEGLVVGKVVLRRPDGVAEPIPATLRWIVTDGDPETEAIRQAPSLACADDGTFVVSPSATSGTIYLIASHPDGVMGYVQAKLPTTEELVIELAPAGGIEIRLPGNRLAFRALLSPAGPIRADPRQPPDTLVVDGAGEKLRCGGIPLRWGSARLSILWRDGGRIEAPDVAALRFRAWTVITIPMYDYAASVFGAVVDSAGNPQAGVSIEVFRPGGPGARVPSVWDRTSGGGGAFRFENLPPGPLTLTLWKEGHAPLRQNISLTAGQALDLGTITLAPGATLRGRVVGLQPDRRRAVRVTRSKVGLLSYHAVQGAIAARCDAQGHYEYDGVGPGEWLLALCADGHDLQAPWVGQVVTVTDTDSNNGAVVPVPDLGPVDRLAWHTSFPPDVAATVAGARIFARGVDRPWAAYGNVAPGGAIALSVPRGRFLLGMDLYDGLRWLGVFSTEAAPPALELPTGSVTLTGRPSIPKGKSYVEVFYTGGPTWPQGVLPLEGTVAPLSGDASSCAIDGLTAGSYEIRISVYGHQFTSTVVLGAGESKSIPWPVSNDGR